MNHTTAVATAYPPNDVVPDTKGWLPPKSGAPVSDADAAARFFASDRFATLCAHAYDLGALQQPGVDAADGGDGGAVEALLGLPTLHQLVLDADAGDGRYLVPGADADDRQRLMDAWAARVVRVVPTPPVRTPEEWLAQQTAIARAAGPPSATRMVVKLVTAVARDFVARPHRWALSGVAVLFATTGAQKTLVKALGHHLVPIFASFYASDVDTVNRLSTDLATALARQFVTLPGTVWSVLGDKRLSPAHAAGRIAVRVALPLTTNLILLSSPSMLLQVGAGAAGVTALLALTPLGDAVLGETLATRAGQMGATLTLTGATALTAKLALQTMPGVSFAAGTLQFAVASQLTTQVAQSMIATMSEGTLISPEAGPTAFKLLLQEAEHHYVFLKFRYHAREAARKVGARARRVYGATWGRVVDPLLPPWLRRLSPALVASFATAWGLWFAYCSLPFHLDALQYECHTWAEPLRDALKRLMPWLAGMATRAGVPNNTQKAVAEQVAQRAGMAYRIFHQGVYQQLWHPFLTHLLQDQLELPGRAMAAVDGVLDACKRRYPWAEAVLAYKPFAKVVKHELLQRWHLDYLFHASLEHLFLRSPLSTFLSLATDTRQGTPQKLVRYLVTDAAEPFVRSMRAVYDARADVYTGVRLAFVEASNTTSETALAPTTDALLGRLADATERTHATAPPRAYAELQDAWAEYAEAFGSDNSGHHPDATADTQRRATFARLTREVQTDRTTRTLPEWCKPEDARRERVRQDQVFVHECHRLTRDLRHGVQQRRRAEADARRVDVDAYRLRVDRETKRAYLRDVEYAAKVMRNKLGVRDATDAPRPPGFVAADVTEAELDADVSVDDLRAMAYGYRETTEAVATWAAVQAEARQLANAPKAPPLPSALQERLERTQQYATRLMYPFEADKSAGIGRLWMGIHTYNEDLATLKQLTRATEALVADHRRRLLVYQSYVDLVGETHRPNEPTDAEWADMEALVYAVKVVRWGKPPPEVKKVLKGTTDRPPKTVAEVFGLFHTHDKPVANKARRVANDRRSEWAKRSKQRDRAMSEWDKVLRDRYGRRASALQMLMALEQADVRGHTAVLRTLRGRMQRRRREGTLRLDDASQSSAHVFAATADAPDLRAWVAANTADSATRTSHAEAEAILRTLPDSHTMAKLRQELVLDRDAEGLERFDRTFARVRGDLDSLRHAHDDLVSLRKVAFWQQAQSDLARVRQRAPLQTRSWWPFTSPRWTEWKATTAKAHRAALDDHVRRVTSAHLPIAAHAFESVDVAATGGGWATLVDGVPPDQMPAVERQAAVAYLKALGQHERQLRAYVDVSLDTELERVVQPEAPLPTDAEAPALRKSTHAALATLRSDLVPHHAEREGYVHPLLQSVTEWTDARYSVHNERQRVRRAIRTYTDSLHGKTDAYTTHRSLAHLKQAQTARQQAWTNRPPLPQATTTRRPDRSKTGRPTATGKASTSETRHVEAQLQATVQAEARMWKDELEQLDKAVALAEAMASAQAPKETGEGPSSDLASRCDKWAAELAALARTPDGASLANALRPQLLALRATDTLYTQTQALATAQTAWVRQLAAVQAHTAPSTSVVDYLTRPLAQLNPFAPSLNADTRSLLAHTATLSEMAKQVRRSRQAQAATLSTVHAEALDAEWDRLSRAREPVLREALDYVETQFEASNRAYEQAVYTRDGKGSTRPEWQLNERRELQYLAWQRLRGLQVPGRLTTAFAKDPRVFKVNQRVAHHRQALRLRDQAATVQWTPETLAKQRELWRTLSADSTTHPATVAAAEATYLTGRAKLLGAAHANVEHAVATALAKGMHPPSTLITPDVRAAMAAYDRQARAHPTTTAVDVDKAHAALTAYVREWPARWQAVADAKAGETGTQSLWTKRSEALVQDAPSALRESVRAWVEQRRPTAPPVRSPPLPSDTLAQAPPSRPGAWTWPWWTPTSTPTTTEAPPLPAAPDVLPTTLQEAQEAWDDYTRTPPADLHVDIRRPQAEATYAALQRLDAHVEALRKLSARYDAMYERASNNERRETAASTVRAAHHAQLREAEATYQAAEQALADHWRDTATRFDTSKRALTAAVDQGNVYDTAQRYPPDERVRRLTHALTSTQYKDAYTQAAYVPPHAVGRMGSALRQTTDALRPHATREASPAAWHEKLPTTTTSPPGELARHLMVTDHVRTFGQLDTVSNTDVLRMEQQRRDRPADPVTLPKAYQTTHGIQTMLAVQLHMSVKDIQRTYNVDEPYYGFQKEMEALSTVQALNVAHLVEQSPLMRKQVGVTSHDTTLAIARTLAQNPMALAKLDRSVKAALQRVDDIPAYKGMHKQIRHVSIEGEAVALRVYTKNALASVVQWFGTGAPRYVFPQLPSAQPNPTRAHVKDHLGALHPNDTRALTTLIPDEQIRNHFLVMCRRREAGAASVTGRALEQYAIRHADAWDFDDVHGKALDESWNHFGETLNLVHANLRSSLPTFDWRVAMYELAASSDVLNDERVKTALGAHRQTAPQAVDQRVTQLNTLKSLYKVLQDSSVVAGDNPAFWQNTRKDGTNPVHTGGYARRLMQTYPFLIKPTWTRSFMRKT